MANVLDVAAYILRRQGSMTAMKLQKLVYYSQAWSLVWDEKPLFRERIEAWANGPVVPELFDAHRGRFAVASISGGDPSKLTANQEETVKAVLGYYGDKPSQWLSDLTHMEDPWKDARKGLSETARGNRVITHEAMANYYSSLLPDA
jgi:uncharacterized phage-associated protein